MNRCKVLIAAIAALCLGAGDPENSPFAARRAAVMKKIGRGAALLAGAPETRAYVPFRQDNDFYYLTGVEAPGSFLLIDGGARRSVLFLRPRSLPVEQWEGARLYAGEEARRLTGIEEVLEVSKLEEELRRRSAASTELFVRRLAEETAAASRDRAYQYDVAQEANPWDGRVSRERALETSLKRRLGDGVRLADLSPVLDELRRVKDAAEIARMREASRIAAAGLRAAIGAAQPGQFEYQLAALAGLVFRWNGAPGDSYFPLVGSGPNSCIVHYHDNSRRLEAGDIVVMDYGPDYRYYQADVTRTFPVSASFTDEQRRIYRIVLEAQNAALAQVRPGATFRELNRAARDVIERAGYGKYWLHGVSHYIGMSTHDVGEPVAFEPGVVVTVEPGIYIAEKNLGVRIEDTVLVTQNGHESLSRDVPREIDEVEKLRKSGASDPGLPFRLALPGLR